MRAQVDALSAHVASNCAAAALKLQQDPHQQKAGSVALRGLQLASLQLLLASVLSPVPHRPPFLAQALQLFQAARWVQVWRITLWALNFLFSLFDLSKLFSVCACGAAAVCVWCCVMYCRVPWSAARPSWECFRM